MSIHPAHASFLSPNQFAQMAGISLRAAQWAFQNACQGKQWRGHRLPIIAVPGQRGGNGGTVWGLAVDHCDAELQAMLVPVASNAVENTLERPVNAPIEGRQIEEQQARWRILQPILQTPKGTAARASVIREVAARSHHYPGGARQFSQGAIRDWIALFERKGLAGLLPSLRVDRGVARVLMTRLWDTTIDLADDTKAEIATRITREAQSMAANDGTSDREIIRLCSLRLEKYSISSGSRLPSSRLKAICKLNTKWSGRLDLGRFRLVHMRGNDHKAWQDRAIPRIRRKLHDTPMGLLVGDVHYVDMLVKEGQEPVRVRLIAWLDTSSLFTWVTPVFLSKGKGITQEDVAKSLSQVAFCPHGGIPLNYYLDNGSEYAALSDAMMRLSNLAEMAFGVTLAKPYSPTSKGEIEGYFNILEGIFKGLPGWIGGDRTDKKTQNKGEVVSPYSKGIAALEADIQAAVAIYNTREQSGRLSGLSPLDMLERKISDTGFVARVPSEEAFDLIFSRPDGRTIRQGTIRYDNRQWHTPAIDDLPISEQVEILIPLRKRCDRVFVRHAGKALGWAEPLPEFAHGDREGARLQSRLEKGRTDAVRKLAKQIDPAISTFELQKAAVDRIAPNSPAPEFWTRAIDKTAMPPSAAELEAAEDARRRADMDEALALYSQSRREASGGNR